jgi:hypothetical protein
VSIGEKHTVFATTAPPLILPFGVTDWVIVTRAGVTYHTPATSFVPSSSSYQKVVPLTGNTLTAGAGLGAFVIVPAGQLATLTVILPPNPADGQIFSISTTQNLVALTPQGAAGNTVVDAVGYTVGANGGVAWRFVIADLAWYRVY